MLKSWLRCTVLDSLEHISRFINDDDHKTEEHDNFQVGIDKYKNAELLIPLLEIDGSYDHEYPVETVDHWCYQFVFEKSLEILDVHVSNSN